MTFPVLFRLLVVGGAVGSDIMPPDYSTAEDGDVTNATVAVQFSEAVSAAGDDYISGVTIKVNGVSATINSATRQTNQALVYYVLAAAPDANDTITWEYSDPVGVIADLAGNQMGDVTPQAVTNNVGTHLWFDNDADSMHALVTMRL